MARGSAINVIYSTVTVAAAEHRTIRHKKLFPFTRDPSHSIHQNRLCDKISQFSTDRKWIIILNNFYFIVTSIDRRFVKGAIRFAIYNHKHFSWRKLCLVVEDICGTWSSLYDSFPENTVYPKTFPFGCFRNVRHTRVYWINGIWMKNRGGDGEEDGRRGIILVGLKATSQVHGMLAYVAYLNGSISPVCEARKFRWRNAR